MKNGIRTLFLARLLRLGQNFQTRAMVKDARPFLYGEKLSPPIIFTSTTKASPPVSTSWGWIRQSQRKNLFNKRITWRKNTNHSKNSKSFGQMFNVQILWNHLPLWCQILTSGWYWKRNSWEKNRKKTFRQAL